MTGHYRTLISLFVKIVIRFLDFLLFLLFLAVFVFQTIYLKFQYKNLKNQKINILRLIEGGDLESIFKKYGNLESYFYHLIPRYTNLVIGSNHGTKNNFLLRLRNDYVLMETWYSRHFPLISSLYFLSRHIQIVIKYKISLIHSNSPYILGFYGVILSRILSLPVCVSIHADYERSESLQGNVIPRIFGSIRISRWVEKFVYQKVDMILPIRKHMRDYLLKVGCSEDKIRIFPHGIDMNDIYGESNVNVRELFKIPEGVKIVSSAARLEKENYCDDLVDIAIRCVKSIENLCFIICGGGSQLLILEESVRHSGLQKHILLPGDIAQRTVFEIRKQCDINLCLRAGFSLIEACASGKPVISYDVDWHSELVKNGESGFLVAENDTDEVIEKIEYLLNNPERGHELGEKAKKLALEKHSLEVTNRKKAQIYRELLGEKQI